VGAEVTGEREGTGVVSGPGVATTGHIAEDARRAECRWCGKPATAVREVIAASTTSPAIVADVCDDHAAMVDRNRRRQELEAAIPRLSARMAHSSRGTSRHAVIVGELRAARLELSELNS
jgi:hypothetical protein